MSARQSELRRLQREASAAVERPARIPGFESFEGSEAMVFMKITAQGLGIR